MTILEEIKKIVEAVPAEIKEDDGVYVLEFLVAERKAFLSNKKLTYRAKFRIDEEKKEVRFTERLKESGFGLSTGGNGFDSNMSPGFGFKKQTYSVGLGGEREETIEEQSNLFGKKYDYKFNFGELRKKIEAKAKEAGYQFIYKITGWGL